MHAAICYLLQKERRPAMIEASTARYQLTTLKGGTALISGEPYKLAESILQGSLISDYRLAMQCQ